MAKNLRAWLLLFLTGLGIAGCQTYHPHPLTAEGVDQALRAPDMNTLSERASRLHQPLLPPVAIDLRNGLDPDEAAVVAVLTHPMLRAVRDERGLADAQVLQAGLLPNPQLSGSVDPVTGGVTAGTVTGYSYGASWDLSALVARGANVASARANRSSVELDVAWQEWQVAQAARLAVYNLIALQEQAALSRQVRDRLADNLALVEKAEQAGLMTELDVSAAETAGNQAEADWVDLKSQVRQQRLALNRALGLPPETPISLQTGIVLPSRLDLPPEQDVVSGLEERRLDLMALRKGYESQEAAVRAAVLGQFPKINLGLGQARDTSDIITMPFAVSVDLPVFDRNQGAISLERATRERLYDEYVSRIFEARSEISSLMANAAGIEEQLHVAEAAVPSLERLVDLYREALEQGQADALVTYTAWNDLTTQRLKITSLKQQLIQTRIALEIAAGVYELGSLRHTPAAMQPAAEEVKP